MKKVCILEMEGGADKESNGMRKDTVMLMDALRAQGAIVVHMYYRKGYDLGVLLQNFDVLLPRVNPSANYTHGTFRDFFTFLSSVVADYPIKCIPEPSVMEKLGSKMALVALAQNTGGLPSTIACYDEASLRAVLDAQTEDLVFKRNKGSQGEGVYVVGTDMTVTHAFDNSKKTMSVDEFIGILGKDNEPIIVQKFLPNITEGEIRINMIYDKPIELVKKVPKEGGISATLRSGAKYTKMNVYDSPYRRVVHMFMLQCLPFIPKLLGFNKSDLPLLWTVDFIPYNDSFVITDINCTCVGLAQQENICKLVADLFSPLECSALAKKGSQKTSFVG